MLTMKMSKRRTGIRQKEPFPDGYPQDENQRLSALEERMKRK